MKFRFPIVIIDEDFRSENTSGLGIRALAAAMEKEGMEVLGVTSYGDLSQFAQQQSRASAFVLSIDDEEFGEGSIAETDSALIARRIGVLQFVTAATPAYLNKHGRPQHPTDLAQHRCVNYFSSRTGKTFDWDFVRGEETIFVPAPACLAVNDSVAYLTAGLQGLGLVQMASYKVHPLVASGQMELVLTDWTSVPLPVNVVYPQNRHLSAKVRVFVEWVAELFADHPGLQLQRN